MKSIQRKFVLLALGCAFCLATAHAITIGGSDYFATGATENLDVVFTTPTGGVTVNQYSGFVQVSVSGVGNSRAFYLNDAFYIDDDLGIRIQSGAYQLAFSTDPLAGLVVGGPGDPNYPLALNSMVYDLDAGLEVTPSYTPAFQTTHVYNFVLNTSLITPGALYFGVADGRFDDNGGQYHISVTQLSQSVPDAGSTLVLVAISGVALLATSRKCKRLERVRF